MILTTNGDDGWSRGDLTLFRPGITVALIATKVFFNLNTEFIVYIVYT